MLQAFIKVDDRVFKRAMTGFEKQIPYAISKALNQTAKDAVSFLRDRMPATFTIRNRWEQQSVTFNVATKRDLQVEIGSRHDYMKEQVLGGEKRAKSGKTLAVPVGKGRMTYGAGKPRPTLRSMTRPARWPGAYLTKSGKAAFLGRAGAGRRLGVFRRVGERLKMMWHIVRSVTIKPRWDLQGQVQSIVSLKWPQNCLAAMEHALKTAKGPG